MTPEDQRVLNRRGVVLQQLAYLANLAHPHPAGVTAVRLAGLLDDLERADTAGDGQALDYHLTKLMRLIRGQL